MDQMILVSPTKLERGPYKGFGSGRQSRSPRDGGYAKPKRDSQESGEGEGSVPGVSIETTKFVDEFGEVYALLPPGLPFFLEEGASILGLISCCV